MYEDLKWLTCSLLDVMVQRSSCPSFAPVGFESSAV